MTIDTRWIFHEWHKVCQSSEKAQRATDSDDLGLEINLWSITASITGQVKSPTLSEFTRRLDCGMEGRKNERSASCYRSAWSVTPKERRADIGKPFVSKPLPVQRMSAPIRPWSKQDVLTGIHLRLANGCRRSHNSDGVVSFPMLWLYIYPGHKGHWHCEYDSTENQRGKMVPSLLNTSSELPTRKRSRIAMHAWHVRVVESLILGLVVCLVDLRSRLCKTSTSHVCIVMLVLAVCLMYGTSWGSSPPVFFHLSCMRSGNVLWDRVVDRHSMRVWYSEVLFKVRVSMTVFHNRVLCCRSMSYHPFINRGGFSDTSPSRWQGRVIEPNGWYHILGLQQEQGVDHIRVGREW